jgi:hypothetical protein
MFVGRIEPSPLPEFLQIRDNNPANRVVWVGPVNQRKIVIIGSKSKLIGNLFEFGRLCFGQFRYLLNFRDIPGLL